MFAEETDLITHLLADNRKLRQLYLAEQKKALTERKRRITAEARLAALLSKKVMEMRERNPYVLCLFSFRISKLLKTYLNERSCIVKYC